MDTQAGINPTAVIQSSKTQAHLDDLFHLFLMAAKLGLVDMIRAIIEQVPANFDTVTYRMDGYGFYAIHYAAASGHVDVVSVLLEKKPDLCHQKDGKGWTPLHHAIAHSFIPVMKVILRTDLAAITDVTPKRETCLHIAVKHRGLEQLELLLDALGDEDNGMLNYRDDEGTSILHVAVSYKLLLIVESILGYGRLNINLQNEDGLTALDLCDRGENDGLIEERLCAAGAQRTDPILHSTAAERQVNLVGDVFAAAALLGNPLDVLKGRLFLTILFMFSIFILLGKQPLLLRLPFLVGIGILVFFIILTLSLLLGRRSRGVNTLSP